MIMEEWNKLGNLSIEHKLKYLKKKEWNKSSFGMVNQQIKNCQLEIYKLDLLADDKILSKVEESRLQALRARLAQLTTRKGQITRQYVKIKNITNKDQNSKFFHALSTCRMRKKGIFKVRIGDRVFKGKKSIQRAIRSHFEEHFQQPQFPKIELPAESFKKLDHIS